jgi:trimethylamine--corrinoid protein Co-methyltransferase
MYIAGHAYDLMTPAEIDLVHQGALRILREMGMEIQNDRLLQLCAEAGLVVDFTNQRARFPTRLVESFIAESDHVDWTEVKPHVSASAGVYHSLFHDPRTGALLPWTEESMAFYFRLARQLPHVGVASMLGSRMAVPAPLEPLYERYFCWKYGADEGGSIYIDEICPYLLELYQVWADVQHKPLEQVFQASVYLVPAFKLCVHEAFQLMYFWERGLRVGIGDMLAMGASAPVTVSGAVTLNLAERLALSILRWILCGEKHFHLGISLAPLDLQTMIYPFGRPETAVANLMTAQLARHYGASFSGHSGLTSAKLPSVEVGYQKALTALPTLMAGGSFWMDAGLLAVDEVCSPVQLILDNEFLSALKHFAKDYQVTPQVLGIEAILEAGPGGSYLGAEHTIQYMRQELWQPALWTRHMLRPWQEAGSKLDIDLARQIALDIQDQAETLVFPETHERALLKVINHARENLVGS